MSHRKIIGIEPSISSISASLTAVKPQNGKFSAQTICKAVRDNVHISLEHVIIDGDDDDDLKFLLNVEDKKNSANGAFLFGLKDLLMAMASDFTRQITDLDKKTDKLLDDQAQADLAKKQYKEVPKDRENPKLKDFYDINCPHCNHEQVTKPSVFHKHGVNDLGKGVCGKCHRWMDVIYQPETDTMKTRQQTDYYNQGH